MGKKSLCLLLTVLLAALCIAPQALATTSAVVDLPSTYTGLNVRSGPGLSYDVVAWVLEGDRITILEPGNTWSLIKIAKNGKSGYIKNCFFDESGDPETPPTGASYDVGRVSAKYASSYINLRKGPGTAYPTVGSAKSGTRLKLLGGEGNWHYAETVSGLRGYISRNYVAAGAPCTTTARVNLRQSPNGSVIKTLPYGSSATLLSVSGSWSKVKSGSTTGYVFSRYLR